MQKMEKRKKNTPGRVFKCLERERERERQESITGPPATSSK
jgi:hypothetical protein